MFHRMLFALAMWMTLSFAHSSLDAAPFVAERNAQCVAYSPDGTLVATGKSGMSNSEFPPRPHPTPTKCAVVQIWDVATGELRKRMETFGDLTKVQFSPDGKSVAASRLFATSDGVDLPSVLLWDVNSGRLQFEFNRCRAFDFSPDGATIAVLSRTRCVLFDANSYEKLREVKPLGRALSVQFAPDGKQIAGVRAVDDNYAIILCGFDADEIVAQSQPLGDPFFSVVFSPDGTLCASGHPAGTVLVWDRSTLKPIAQFRTGGPGLQHPFFSPDGALLAAGDQENGDVVFWDLRTRKEVRRYTFERGSFQTFYRRDDDQRERPETDPTRFVFSPDGGAFLVGCYGGFIRLVSDGSEVRRFRD